MTEQTADAHIHICKDDWRFGADLVFTWNDLAQRMREKEIHRALVLPMISNTDDSININREFFKEAEEFEFHDQIWTYYWPHPSEVNSEFFNDVQVDGIKYHPSISQVRIDQAADVIKAALTNNLPLLVHCGRNPMSRINYLLTASRMEPDVCFIGAHLGGLANELILDAIRQLDNSPRTENIFLDSSGCMNPKILRHAIDIVGSDRILWGTDTPFFDSEVSKFVLERTGIQNKDMRKILYENAFKLHNRS